MIRKSTESETIAANMAKMNRMLAQQARANVAGGTCPKCGKGANPTIVAALGHCLICQRAVFSF